MLRALMLTLLLLAPPALAQAPRDLAQEERNRALVVEFYETVFQRRELAAAERFVAEGYIQHNPRVPDGRAAFMAFATRLFAATPEGRTRLVRAGTMGDLVFLHIHSQGSANDRGRAIVDIYRVANGMIVEHWDVIQEVPEQAANPNGMF